VACDEWIQREIGLHSQKLLKADFYRIWSLQCQQVTKIKGGTRWLLDVVKGCDHCVNGWCIFENLKGIKIMTAHQGVKVINWP